MSVSERVALFMMALVASTARADVTGSFDGQASDPRVSPTINAAATFTQSGKAITGTIAIDGTLAGAYLVVGKATPKRLKVSGVGPRGTKLTWKAKISGDSLTGKAKLKGASKITGLLTLARNVSAGDGSGCDSVYTQNTTTFTDDVLGRALQPCTTCHGPGLQAGSTRLQVTSDALATARSLALQVDSANPDASRALAKPLLLVPHGGNQQLVAGSPEEVILRNWVHLVAQAHCN